MSTKVYKGYDKEALYAQYNNRAQISEEALDKIKSDQNERSAEYRRSAVRKHLDLSYGDHPRERLDIYLPETNSSPLFAFIHGGYWQWNDKEGFDFLAKEINARGSAFANIEYALCPEVSLTELTNQCRRAICYLWLNASRYGYDRERIIVSGHSAGGHLTAMMQATDWRAFNSGLSGKVIAAGLPISGIYDLEPIKFTPLNEAIKIDDAEVTQLSPMFLQSYTNSDTTIAFGGAEYDEFHRQGYDLEEALKKQGISASTLKVTDRDHFTVLSALAEPQSTLFLAALELLGLE